jgi:hypothetical protein
MFDEGGTDSCIAEMKLWSTVVSFMIIQTHTHTHNKTSKMTPTKFEWFTMNPYPTGGSIFKYSRDWLSSTNVQRSQVLNTCLWNQNTKKYFILSSEATGRLMYTTWFFL